jgi:hypothetical protein
MRQSTQAGSSSPPAADGIKAFAKELADKTINPEPGNAAPGLSAHGQMRAVDFVVMQSSTPIATTDTATSEAVWRQPSWAKKLADETTSAGFKGHAAGASGEHRAAP